MSPKRPNEKPVLSLVAAVAENGVIGHAGRLPWHLPADLKHFRETTLGKPMLMGRRTFDSIGKALPGRRSLVLTRDPDFSAPGVEVVRSLEEALAAARDADEIAVIGGADLYRLTLPHAGRVYLTRVHAAVPGDTRFPEWDSSGWRCVSRTTHPADEKNQYAMTFFTLEAPQS
jgi:dihydrofolate reductase